MKASAAEAAPTPQQAYQAMIALKAQYPEGTSWSNSNYYAWHGGLYSGGYGCAGFAFMLSDAAFGSLPARRLTQFAFSDVQVGDILRLDNDTHSVIVLEVHGDHVVITEGNYNYSVHWGRQLTAAEVLAADYVITRYPEDTIIPTVPVPAAPAPAPAFTDVPSWFETEVAWAAQKGITNGYGGSTTFAPNVDCTQIQILTMLWRAEDRPPSDNTAFSDLAGDYAPAANWAYDQEIIDDSFHPDAPCTRAQAVQYIWKALGEKKAAEEASFSDVAANASYAGAVS
ncbi:MAG: S-layer homology domain-containing protein, partial [Clostridiales bacterium]|nr:S-layer homology domain-containing protein [Clostridiales bacterium]